MPVPHPVAVDAARAVPGDGTLDDAGGHESVLNLGLCGDRGVSDIVELHMGAAPCDSASLRRECTGSLLTGTRILRKVTAAG